MRKQLLLLGLCIALQHFIANPCPCSPNTNDPLPFFLQGTDTTGDDNDEAENE